MPPTHIIDPTDWYDRPPVADIEEIRRRNPHRGQMEHLTAILHMDPEQSLAIGYKDVRDDEFWAAGHMPGYPIMPGVIQLEAAAQLMGFYVRYYGILKDALMGLGGIEAARFRAPVRPGDRLLIAGNGRRVDRRQTIFHVQGFVGAAMAFHCDVIGVPIPGWDRTATAKSPAEG